MQHRGQRAAAGRGRGRAGLRVADAQHHLRVVRPVHQHPEPLADGGQVDRLRHRRAGQAEPLGLDADPGIGLAGAQPGRPVVGRAERNDVDGPFVDQVHQRLAAGDAGLEVPNRHVGVPGRTGRNVRDRRGRHPVGRVGGAGPVRQLGPVGRVGQLHPVRPGEHHGQVELLVSPLHGVRVDARVGSDGEQTADRLLGHRLDQERAALGVPALGRLGPLHHRPVDGRPGHRPDPGQQVRVVRVGQPVDLGLPAGGGEPEPGQLQRRATGQQHRPAVRVQRRQLPGPVRVQLQHAGRGRPTATAGCCGSRALARRTTRPARPRTASAYCWWSRSWFDAMAAAAGGPVPKVPNRRGLRTAGPTALQDVGPPDDA